MRKISAMLLFFTIVFVVPAAIIVLLLAQEPDDTQNATPDPVEVQIEPVKMSRADLDGVNYKFFKLGDEAEIIEPDSEEGHATSFFVRYGDIVVEISSPNDFRVISGLDTSNYKIKNRRTDSLDKINPDFVLISNANRDYIFVVERLDMSFEYSNITDSGLTVRFKNNPEYVFEMNDQNTLNLTELIKE